MGMSLLEDAIQSENFSFAKVGFLKDGNSLH